MQFVATAPVAAMWLKYYVRTVEFDTDMGVVPSSVHGEEGLVGVRNLHPPLIIRHKTNPGQANKPWTD